MKNYFYALILLAISYQVNSQPHLFLDEVFERASVTKDIQYASNATILYFPQLGQAIPEALTLDLYEPAGDTAALRPLIIYFHSGSFIPFPFNGSVEGTKRDSAVVEMCRRLARSGFVVASADYRLGWNPLSGDETTRAATLINAAYRGVQDANTCIRFFKKSYAEHGNPYKIDTSRIVLWGDDTGGYIALHAACLDSYDKIPAASEYKFLIPTGIPDPPFIPMIFESLNGDVEGKNFGVMTPELSIFVPFPIGDTLCYSHYPEFSSKFNVAVNMGGAVADTAWIDEGQPPMINVHAPYDLTTPYMEDWLYVAGQRIIKVQGSYLVTYMADSLGNNYKLSNPWDVPTLTFDPTDIINEKNDGLDGLYPVIGDTITDGTPWSFWDPATNVNSANGLLYNPHMTRGKAELYMDTILAYVLPRIYNGIILWELTNTNEIVDPFDVTILTYPNPSMDEVFIASKKDYVIRGIGIYDMKGSLVDQHNDINDYYFHLPVDQLIPGPYILKFQFDYGIAARQIIVK